MRRRWKKLLGRFKECLRTIRFFVTTGGYNLFALIFAKDYIHSLESVSLEKCSLRSQEGVRRFELYPIQKVKYESFLDIGVLAEKFSNTHHAAFTAVAAKDMSRKGVSDITKYHRGRL